LFFAGARNRVVDGEGRRGQCSLKTNGIACTYNEVQRQIALLIVRRNQLKRIVIVSAQRTPQGRFLGSLGKYSAAELATSVGRSMLQNWDRNGEALRPDLTSCIDEVILGNVLSSGVGMNIARQVAIRLGLPVSVSAFTINMMCASGLKAIMLGCDAIRAGNARMVLCGGTESMSQAPYLLPRVRMGLKLGDSSMIDSVLKDGLVDAFDQQHMGVSAERLAREFGITRSQQDAFALESQRRYWAAAEAGAFAAEMVPVGNVRTDEHPRPDTTLLSLGKLATAFDPSGTITAGNASGLNDGASLVLLSDEEFAQRNGLNILAVIDAYTTAGCDPARMGLGPVVATRKLMLQQGTELDQFDTIELNEAFAVQVLACLQELPIDADKLNPDGGSIAVGHPIGATGARLVVHIAQRIAAGRSQRALATLCVGGGMGAAMSLAAQ
jgi:acetyl-CoA C-acetyltransferase